MKKTVWMVVSGDLRLPANRACEAAQAAMEKSVVAAVEAEGFKVRRAHGFDPVKKHSFIDSQKYGMEVFKNIPPDAPLIVAEAVWQYSHHVLPGLITHKGPILTLANWSGQWPGLVGTLNLNGCLTRVGRRFSRLWSEDFTDSFFRKALRSWLNTGTIRHDLSHVHAFNSGEAPRAPLALGIRVAKELRDNKAIMGIFDEGCMGMFNAMIPDELLHAAGVFKERLSQSALYAKMLTVKKPEAQAVLTWMLEKGMTIQFGKNPKTDLTKEQVLEQCRMYIAAVRIAAEFGCDCIGIQYQQGLKDLCAASDLAEGLLNNVDRPPVFDAVTGQALFAGNAVPHFNEVDECAGLDALVTNRVWRKLGYSPETTLHDIRWGRQYTDKNLDAYVWVFLISGAAPPAHFIGGYKGAGSERQPVVYFPKGGGTLKGVSKPGWVVWSRVFVEDNRLKFDTGLAEVVKLPDAETQERWTMTTSQWPIMHAVLQGITRDQMMARHKANHIQVAYAPARAGAIKALTAKAAAMQELGMEVSICGEV